MMNFYKGGRGLAYSQREERASSRKEKPPRLSKILTNASIALPSATVGQIAGVSSKYPRYLFDTCSDAVREVFECCSGSTRRTAETHPKDYRSCPEPVSKRTRSVSEGNPNSTRRNKCFFCRFFAVLKVTIRYRCIIDVVQLKNNPRKRVDAIKNKVTLCLAGLLCFMLFNLSEAWGQSAEPRTAEGQIEIKPLLLGQKVSEEFWTSEHLFYVNGDTVRKTLEEYRGKLLILDFWSSWCAVCIHHMKAERSLFEQYREDVVLLPINPQSTKDNFRAVDETYRRHFEPYFRSVFLDRYFSEVFPIYAYPTYVWIDRSGTYVAATTSISEGHIAQIVNKNKKNTNN